MSQNMIKCEEGKQYLTANGSLTTELIRVADDYYKGYITSSDCISSLIWADDGTVIRIGEAIPSPKTKKDFQLVEEYMKEDVISLHEKVPGSLLGCRQCNKQVTDLIGGCCGIECHSKKWNIHFGTAEYEKYRKAFLDVFQYNEEVKAEKFNLVDNPYANEPAKQEPLTQTYNNLKTFHTTFTRKDIEVNKEPVKSSFAPPYVEIKPIADEEVIASGGVKFETGAVRSADCNNVCYHLISPIALRRMDTFLKQNKIQISADHCLVDALETIYSYLEGDELESLLEEASYSLMLLMNYKDKITVSTEYKDIFDLPRAAFRRLAETYAEGRAKYPPFNWERGMPIGECLNHAIRHILIYQTGDRSEDHLSHANWNLWACMHMEETHPEIAHQLRPNHPLYKNLMP